MIIIVMTIIMIMIMMIMVMVMIIVIVIPRLIILISILEFPVEQFEAAVSLSAVASPPSLIFIHRVSQLRSVSIISSFEFSI